MYFAFFFPPCILCSLRQCECLCVGGRGVWSKAGQSQQEGPDLDMVVKFHWLTGGSLHWLLSVELIIHMVGGREWKPPQKKKETPKTWPQERRQRGCEACSWDFFKQWKLNPELVFAILSAQHLSDECARKYFRKNICSLSYTCLFLLIPQSIRGLFIFFLKIIKVSQIAWFPMFSLSERI